MGLEHSPITIGTGANQAAPGNALPVFAQAESDPARRALGTLPAGSVCNVLGRNEVTVVSGFIDDVSGSLNGLTFSIFSDTGKIGIYFRVTGMDDIPPEGVDRAIPVEIDSDATAATVAAAAAAVLDNDADFSAILAEDLILTITDAVCGVRGTADAGTSGLTLVQSVSGKFATGRWTADGNGGWMWVNFPVVSVRAGYSSLSPDVPIYTNTHTAIPFLRQIIPCSCGLFSVTRSGIRANVSGRVRVNISFAIDSGSPIATCRFIGNMRANGSEDGAYRPLENKVADSGTGLAGEGTFSFPVSAGDIICPYVYVTYANGVSETTANGIFGWDTYGYNGMIVTYEEINE